MAVVVCCGFSCSCSEPGATLLAAGLDRRENLLLFLGTAGEDISSALECIGDKDDSLEVSGKGGSIDRRAAPERRRTEPDSRRAAPPFERRLFILYVLLP